MPDGARTEQWSRAELQEADRARDRAAIVAAQRAGHLDELLAGRDPGGPLEPGPTEPDVATPASGSADQGARGERQGALDRATLKRMNSAEIVQAHKSGLLDELLGIRR